MDEMKDILDAIVPEEGAAPDNKADNAGNTADEAENAGTAVNEAEKAGPKENEAENAGTAADSLPGGEPPQEDAREFKGADGDWVTAAEIDGIPYRRLGRKASRVMIVALPGCALNHIKISEMTAVAAVPSGYQIIEAVLPLDPDPAVNAAQETTDRCTKFLRDIYDKVKAEGAQSIYFLAYDLAVPFGILALKDKEIKRAYFISPTFRLPAALGEDGNDKAEGKLVYGPWRTETEILRGSRDDVVPEKELRHFMKNSRSHMQKIDMGHELTDDEQLNAFGRWLTGSRSGRYNDNGFIIAMAVGLLVGYLAGYLITKNSAVGLLAGADCGIILNIVYKKL